MVHASGVGDHVARMRSARRCELVDPGDDSAFRNVTTARHFPVAARGARQLQVGYVCARNQQHKCDRAHQEGHVIPREVAGYFIGIQSRLPPSAQGRLDELLALNAERGFIVSSATRRLDRPFRLDRGCNGDHRFDTDRPSDDCCSPDESSTINPRGPDVGCHGKAPSRSRLN